MSSASRRSARRTAAQVEANRASLEQAKADYETSILAAQAEVDGAKARVYDAEIDLSYCRMSSPIDGRVGLAEVKLGNLVGPAAAGGGADYTELAVVRQLDPMGVDIPVASRYLDRVARLIASGLPVEVFRPGLEGEEARRFPGKATVIDNTIDPTTSTFLIRAEVANPEKTILPGEYVKVNAKVGEARDAIVVPEQAVVETQAGPTVYTVDPQGKVAVAPVRATFTHEGLRVLESGLQPGQQVIVEGLQLVRTGMTVKTRPASPDAPTGPEGPPSTTPGRRRLRGGEPRPTGDAGRCAGFGPGGREGRQGCRQARCASAEAVSHDHTRAAPGPVSTTDADPPPRERDEPWSISSSADPIFATVLALLMLLVGGICIFILPISLYPDIVPPQVQVTTTYTGADAQTVADTVTTPIEQQINGVKGQIYFNSDSTSNGLANIIATFDVGYDQDIAAVDIQNKVSTAQTSLPPEVKQYGVTVKKTSTNMVCVVNLISPDGRYDATFLDNYAQINVVDALKRIPGVSDVNPFGRKYAMRVWLDPDRMANQRISPAEVVEAIQQENKQSASGKIGASPAPPGQRFEYPITSKGRLSKVEEFEKIVVRRNDDGSFVYLSDVARVQLDSENYETAGWLNGKPAGTVPIYQLADANALDIVAQVRARWTGWPGTSPTAWSIGSPTTRPSTSARTSPRCGTRSSRRSCWS